MKLQREPCDRDALIRAVLATTHPLPGNIICDCHVKNG